ncbi:hypothetical protein GPECTOR_49g507 [Gonium pectorale]|uniref:Uncharacterized protein n=1 Tax=Gonium pectorale TaxID=33097 RepID=A0A150G812_GONPE|nr:hypothetical protein GPECTOR_49g507 [Gonium pectorale]|eukprot:KXZ45923.1 hypothetical protein GPECTOR_49g507 [Gonium pectorale]
MSRTRSRSAAGVNQEGVSVATGPASDSRAGVDAPLGSGLSSSAEATSSTSLSSSGPRPAAATAAMDAPVEGLLSERPRATAAHSYAPSALEGEAADGAAGARGCGGPDSSPLPPALNGTPVHYVSDYYPSDTEHVAADSSYAAAHIYGRGPSRGHRAGQEANGRHLAPREASSGGGGPGEGARDHTNAALARMRHNMNVPRQRSNLYTQMAGSDHSGPPSARDDSGSPASPEDGADAAVATAASGRAGVASAPPVSRQGSHAQYDYQQQQQHYQHHLHHLNGQRSARHQSPARQGGAQVDSAGPSYTAGSFPAASAFARQASTTFNPGTAASSRGHDFAVTARQASLAMSNGSARQVQVSRAGSITAMNNLPVMSTVMLASRRFAGAAHRQGGGAGGESGAPSRVGSVTHGPSGSGGSMLARSPYEQPMY